MKRSDTLDAISITKPCPASWDEMAGDDRTRHCSLCQKQVYNLSEMTRDQARRLIESREGSVCVRFYRRQDGKVMTADCPRGLAKVRRRAATLVLACAAFVFASGFAIANAFARRNDSRAWSFKETETFRMLKEWVEPSHSNPLPPTNMPLGAVAMPAPSSPVVISKSGP